MTKKGLFVKQLLTQVGKVAKLKNFGKRRGHTQYRVLETKLEIFISLVYFLGHALGQDL